MKELIAKKTPEEMLRSYQTASRNNGWYYRLDEASNLVWVIEAADIFGRKLSRTGEDPDELVDRIEGEIENDFPAIVVKS